MSWIDNLEKMLREYKENEASEENASIALTWTKIARFAGATGNEAALKNALSKALEYGAKAEEEYTQSEAMQNDLVDQGLA